MSQQRILIITRNLPPLVGGMERLNWHMADELSKYAEVKVIGPKGSAKLKPQSVSLSEAPLKPLPLFLFIAACKAVWFALRWKPDVILAGSGLTAPITWLASKVCGARSVAFLHGLDITVKNTVYQSLWVPCFKKMSCIIVNSTPTKELALAVGCFGKRVSIVYPGVALPQKRQSVDAIKNFKKQHNFKNRKILLSVGRLTERKGIKEFIEYALPAIEKKIPEVVLVVVGETPKNSLGLGLQTQESIFEKAKQLSLENNLVFLGTVSEEMLSVAYESALIHVFPIKEIIGDPEGFGMVAIEAAAHGLPTVAFASGGIVDSVASGRSGVLVEPGDYQGLAESIIELLMQEPSPLQATAEEFAKLFEWSVFGKSVFKVISNTLENNKVD